MLKKKDLIEKVGIEYKDMISQISIPDFTKCIAQYSGLRIQNVPDEMILEYLTLWCVNKKKYFDLFDKNVKVDIEFNYKNPDTDYSSRFFELGHEYPVYYPWLAMIKDTKENKIDIYSYRHNTYDKLIDDAFNRTINVDGMSITRFFKQHLNAPDELVTKIGGIFENREVNATFTISIDPVDIMLNSENPYNWNSCYRLETNGFSDSHADGCLASVIDSHSLITYVWNNHGKFSLYNNYEFKDIRYKRMRMTIATSDDFKAIHFNAIYPGKSNYGSEFEKIMRGIVEEYISKQCGFRNMWKQDFSRANCEREILYGYSEYCDGYIWIQSDSTESYDIRVFDEFIHCPCGCGNEVPPTYENDNFRYNGDGLIYENFYNEHYCEYTEDYEDCDGDCSYCRIWRENNAVCSLNEDEYCTERNSYDAEDEGDADFDNSNVITCNPCACIRCPLFAQHRPEYFKDLIIKQTFEDEALSPILYARVDKKWYINVNNKYYKIDDSRVHSDYDEYELDEITTNLISGLNDEEYFEIYAQYDNGLDLSRFMAAAAKEENNTTLSYNFAEHQFPETITWTQDLIATNSQPLSSICTQITPDQMVQESLQRLMDQEVLTDIIQSQNQNLTTL